jgi:hypothetical protein
MLAVAKAFEEKPILAGLQRKVLLKRKATATVGI